MVSQASHDPSTIRYVSSLFPRTDFSIFARDMVGVRTPEYKYVVTTRETAALFDLKSDPAEQASIYGMYLEKAQEMDDYLASWVAGLRPAPGSGNQADGEPEKPGETGEPPGDQ